MSRFMDTEKYQKELFEFDAPQKAAPKFGNIFKSTGFAVTLTPEKMVFASIGIIMLMVIFFALGVEKGKASVYAARSEMQKPAVKRMASAPVVPAKAVIVPIPAVAPKASIAVTNITTRAGKAMGKAQAPYNKLRPYTIVTAAFSREDFARNEASKLKAAGMDGFVFYGEPYYLACVGSFQSKESAQKALGKVRQMHRDAYVRLR